MRVGFWEITGREIFALWMGVGIGGLLVKWVDGNLIDGPLRIADIPNAVWDVTIFFVAAGMATVIVGVPVYLVARWLMLRTEPPDSRSLRD